MQEKTIKCVFATPTLFLSRTQKARSNGTFAKSGHSEAFQNTSGARGAGRGGVKDGKCNIKCYCLVKIKGRRVAVIFDPQSIIQALPFARCTHEHTKYKHRHVPSTSSLSAQRTTRAKPT